MFYYNVRSRNRIQQASFRAGDTVRTIANWGLFLQAEWHAENYYCEESFLVAVMNVF